MLLSTGKAIWDHLFDVHIIKSLILLVVRRLAQPYRISAGPSSLAGIVFRQTTRYANTFSLWATESARLRYTNPGRIVAVRDKQLRANHQGEACLRLQGFRKKAPATNREIPPACEEKGGGAGGGGKCGGINNGWLHKDGEDELISASSNFLHSWGAAGPEPKNPERAHQSWSQCNNTNEFRLCGSDLLQRRRDERDLIVFCTIIIHLIH